MSDSTPTQTTAALKRRHSLPLLAAWSAAFFSAAVLFVLGSHFTVPLWLTCAVGGASYVLGVTVEERRGR